MKNRVENCMMPAGQEKSSLLIEVAEGKQTAAQTKWVLCKRPAHAHNTTLRSGFRRIFFLLFFSFLSWGKATSTRQHKVHLNPAVDYLVLRF